MPVLPAEKSARKQPKRIGRTRQDHSIPKEGNKVWGDDVPMGWREAARQTGIPPASFYPLMTGRQIASFKVGRLRMVRPSAIRAYLANQETKAY
jgi:hypothetical protein